jgi:hypothetical protein
VSILASRGGKKLEDINIERRLRGRTPDNQNPSDCFFRNPIEVYIIFLRIDPFYYFSVQFPHLVKGKKTLKGRLLHSTVIGSCAKLISIFEIGNLQEG